MAPITHSARSLRTTAGKSVNGSDHGSIAARTLKCPGPGTRSAVDWPTPRTASRLATGVPVLIERLQKDLRRRAAGGIVAADVEVGFPPADTQNKPVCRSVVLNAAPTTCVPATPAKRPNSRQPPAMTLVPIMFRMTPSPLRVYALRAPVSLDTRREGLRGDALASGEHDVHLPEHSCARSDLGEKVTLDHELWHRQIRRDGQYPQVVGRDPHLVTRFRRPGPSSDRSQLFGCVRDTSPSIHGAMMGT